MVSQIVLLCPCPSFEGHPQTLSVYHAPDFTAQLAVSLSELLLPRPPQQCSLSPVFTEGPNSTLPGCWQCPSLRWNCGNVTMLHENCKTVHFSHAFQTWKYLSLGSCSPPPSLFKWMKLAINMLLKVWARYSEYIHQTSYGANLNIFHENFRIFLLIFTLSW